MSQIAFNADIDEINTWHILRLPLEASKKLPSRGMVIIQGTMNGASFKAALEPDGMGSHWFKVSEGLLESAQATLGESVTLEVEPMATWFEPEVPQDLQNALQAADLLHQWNRITTKARWEWIRWIRFTNNPATREKRIMITCSKLSDGKSRPCCFDQSRCTDTDVSKSGILSMIE